MRVAVIGGGLAGLVAAYDLMHHHGCAVTLLEAGERLGGAIETRHLNGFTIECGPDSWVAERPEMTSLATELGCADQIVFSNDAQRRTYLAQGKTLVAMPDGMRMMVPTRWQPLLDSPLFSWSARLAYLREPRRADELRSLAQSRPADFDEPVYAFVERHFGAEVARTIAGPLLSGIFGGDVHQLSAAATMGAFVGMEREHGSLVTAVMARAHADEATGITRPLFASLRGGLQGLTDRLAARLGDVAARLRTPVVRIERSSLDQGWRVDGKAFDRVLLATSTRATQTLLQPLAPELASLLPSHASSAIIVALCFDRAAAARMRVPRGFGFLAPGALEPALNPRLLAATFMHSKFPHTTPQGCTLLRGFFGGSSAPALLGWGDDALIAAARAHLSALLGPLPPAMHAVVHRLPHSLPQYTVGHLQRTAQLEAGLVRLPGLALAGNAYAGVGLSAVVGHARAAARRLATHP